MTASGYLGAFGRGDGGSGCGPPDGRRTEAAADHFTGSSFPLHIYHAVCGGGPDQGSDAGKGKIS